MKTSLTYTNKLLLPFIGAVLLLLSVGAVKAQYLLTVNVTDPNNVIITATGNAPVFNPGTTSASISFNDGVTLEGLLGVSNGFASYQLISSTLTTGDSSSGPVFDSTQQDNLSGSNVDLTLYSSTSNNNATFTEGDPAFELGGSLAFVLTNNTLVAPGTTGEIYTGYSQAGPNTPIGEWVAVETVAGPEPSTWLLLIVALVPMAVYRLRRARVGSSSK